jgi:ABC-type nitrate/sulfonate/bicarbonate transport system substrate-binding protein/outer membrane protein OmpA-like peptidoglycan-associated protein
MHRQIEQDSSPQRGGRGRRQAAPEAPGVRDAPAAAFPPAAVVAVAYQIFRRWTQATCALLLAALAWPLAAVEFVQPVPLAKSVTTPVGNVASGPVQVPIITWGGDIATLHANGNAVSTAPGSIFGKQGLQLRLVREDVFAKQLEAYLAGRSPYLRGTLGMINMAAEAASRDPRTKPVVIYQMTWSSGGDALVVGPNIKSVKDLRGKAIAVQAFGPHVDYLTKILTDGGLSTRDVTLKWVADLTGTNNSPAAALRAKQADAAFVIIPDAMALTSNGTVGTGAEDSVKGARILLSTKTANRIIADVYAVRADYLASNRDAVERLVRGLIEGETALRQLVTNKATRGAEYKTTMSAAAKILLDSEQALADAEGMYGDAQFVRGAGNVAFFADAKNPRRMEILNNEIQQAFVPLGLLASRVLIAGAPFDFARLSGAAPAAAAPEAPRFNQNEVAGIVAKRQSQGRLSEGELFSFEVQFKPNQDKFPAELYADAFKKVASLAATYGGAVITVEGHSDPLGYLRAKKDGASQVVLSRTQQSAKNLSVARALGVRDSVIAFARAQGIALDPTQFAVVGHGIGQPKTGVCGADPCAPKDEQEWLSNMRVEFRVIQIEAEASAFKPL